MRKKWDEQASLFHILPRNKIARELEAISVVLDTQLQILDKVYKDLVRTHLVDTGRDGMTAEQVLRCAILKQYRNLTYEELAFHLEDSQSFRAFAKMRMGQYPSSSTLQENIKALSVESWESVHQAILGYAESQGLEKGRTARMDSTVVETNIHPPTDSTLLQDGIRIITRWLTEGKSLIPVPEYSFVDHNRQSEEAGGDDFERPERSDPPEGLSGSFGSGGAGSGVCPWGDPGVVWFYQRRCPDVFGSLCVGREAGAGGFDVGAGDFADGASGLPWGEGSGR